MSDLWQVLWAKVPVFFYCRVSFGIRDIPPDVSLSGLGLLLCALTGGWRGARERGGVGAQVCMMCNALTI